MSTQYQSGGQLPRRGSRNRLSWLPTAMGLVVALGLVVPESEIRAKGFKLNLIVKNIGRLAAPRA